MQEDAVQRAALPQLRRMLDDLSAPAPKRGFFSRAKAPAPIRGLYLWGGVGRGKSMLMDTMHGKVKLIADAVSGEILGGACTGPMAGELIHEVVVAIHQRMTAQELALVPHYHPTLAEIWTYPAEDIAEAIG